MRAPSKLENMPNLGRGGIGMRILVLAVVLLALCAVPVCAQNSGQPVGQSSQDCSGTPVGATVENRSGESADSSGVPVQTADRSGQPVVTQSDVAAAKAQFEAELSSARQQVACLQQKIIETEQVIASLKAQGKNSAVKVAEQRAYEYRQSLGKNEISIQKLSERVSSLEQISLNSPEGQKKLLKILAECGFLTAKELQDRFDKRYVLKSGQPKDHPAAAQQPRSSETQPETGAPATTQPAAPAGGNTMWWIVGAAFLLVLIVVTFFVLGKKNGNGNQQPDSQSQPQLVQQNAGVDATEWGSNRSASGHPNFKEDDIQTSEMILGAGGKIVYGKITAKTKA